MIGSCFFEHPKRINIDKRNIEIFFINFDHFSFYDSLTIMKNTIISLLIGLLVSTSVFGQSNVVKKSKSGICHVPGSHYYVQTKHYVPFKTLDDCLKSGGKLPRK